MDFVGAVLALLHDAADLHLGAELDPALLQRVVHEGPALLVEAAQHAVATQHQVDLGAPVLLLPKVESA